MAKSTIKTVKIETSEGETTWEVFHDGVLVGEFAKDKPMKRFVGMRGLTRNRGADWRLWFTPTSATGSRTGDTVRIPGATTLAAAKKWLAGQLES